MNTVFPPDPAPADDAIREAAARWHDRLRSERVSAGDHAAFECWCEQSPAHRDAYDAVERAWTQARAQAAHPQILALRQEAALRLTRRTARRPFTLPRAMAAVLALVAVGAVGLSAWRHYDADAPVRSVAAAPARLLDDLRGIDHYRTTVGERLNVVLDDGSLVTLNTRTELRVAYTAGERKIELRHGQALFEVAKDAARPFVVEAQGRRFVAVGTAFDVRVDKARVQLTMLEGRVKVEPTEPAQRSVEDHSASPTAGTSASPQAPQREVILVAGQQLVAAPALALDDIRPADPQRVSSWRTGQVVFEDSTLADAVAELNRYTRVPIRLSDPSLGELRISGAFMTGRNDTFVEAVTGYFPIQARRSPDAIHLVRSPQ